jgi:hypothetical protein
MSDNDTPEWAEDLNADDQLRSPPEDVHPEPAPEPHPADFEGQTVEEALSEGEDQ